MKDKFKKKSIQKVQWGKRKGGQKHGLKPFLTKTKYNR